MSQGKIFVTGCVEAEQKRVLYCLDRKTGAVEWERTVLTSPLEKKHSENSYASSTPAAKVLSQNEVAELASVATVAAADPVPATADAPVDNP